jgi:hypothetical protein
MISYSNTYQKLRFFGYWKFTVLFFRFLGEEERLNCFNVTTTIVETGEILWIKV